MASDSPSSPRIFAAASPSVSSTFSLLSACSLLLRQHVPAAAVHCVQANHILIAQRSDLPCDVGLAAGTLANFTRDLRCERRVLGTSHQFERRAHLSTRNDIEKGRLAQRDAESLLECVVEDGIASGVGEVGQHNRVTFAKGCCPVRLAVEKSCYSPDD